MFTVEQEIMFREIRRLRANWLKTLTMDTAGPRVRNLAKRLFEEAYTALSLSESVMFWQFMIEREARSLSEVEHFQKLQQKAQNALAATF